MQLAGIKNIIFDLGGVIINLDMALTFEAFAKLANSTEIPEYTYERQTQIFKDFEVGALSAADFVEQMVLVLGNNVTHQQVITAWNAMLLDIPTQRLELLLRLKQHYRTFLFSNTNQIHYDAFNKYLLEAHGHAGLEAFFERTYYSQLMGMRKPDVASFQRILNENGLIAQETLFLDDTAGHLKSAETLGIQTQLVTAEEGIMQLFEGI